jgi:hypothetical protein
LFVAPAIGAATLNALFSDDDDELSVLSDLDENDNAPDGKPLV